MTVGVLYQPIAFLGLGFAEIMVIGFVALLVFGGRLPEVMRNLGRTYAKFRHGMSEFTNPIRDEMRRLDIDPRTPARPTAPKTDLPPASDTPPAPYKREDPPSRPANAETRGAPADGPPARQAPADGSAEDASEADAGLVIPSREKRRTPHTTRGVADEPPPV